MKNKINNRKPTETINTFTYEAVNTSYQHDPLWQRLEAFDLDEPNAAFPFSAKLAKENKWDEAFTRTAIKEYKRFVYLCCVMPLGASPPPVVDEVWHLHLCYTVNYWEKFCDSVLQRKLHHQPSKGGPEENEKHYNWLDSTVENYRIIFGEKPPETIWNPALRSGYSSPYTQLKKVVSASAVLVGCLLFGGCTGAMPGLGIIGIFLFIAILTNSQTGNRKDHDGTSDGNSSCSGGGCGSSCGSSCGSGCGSGCGGGCGGCGS